MKLSNEQKMSKYFGDSFCMVSYDEDFHTMVNFFFGTRTCDVELKN